MASGLRPRASMGLAVTNIHSKTNWAEWLTDASITSSPLDMPEPSSFNTPYHLDSSPLSSLEDEDRNNIPFPELDVPELDLQLPQPNFQLVPCYTKSELLKSISAAPDYDLAKLFTITQPNMPTETPQIFHGDGCPKENPADFLKSFNRAMRQQSIAVSTDKLDTFGDYLGTNSQAEVWFKGLSSANKTSWPTFVAAFETRWPPIIIAEKTKVEYEKELLEHWLLETAIGTKTTLYDRECWAHEAWATKAMQLATSTGIAASTSMIWQVRGLLPSIIKDLLKDDEYVDWAAFIKEVKELKGTRLTEKKEQHTKQEQEVIMLHADIARLQQ
jgi:hypothetical protein